VADSTVITPGGDLNDAQNEILFTGTYGGVKITTTSGISYPPGTDGAKITTTNLALTNTSGSAKTITVMFKETNFTGPGGVGDDAYLQGWLDGFSGTGTFTVKYHAQVIENTNALPGGGGGAVYTTNDIVVTGPLAGTSATGIQTFNRTTSTFSLISWAEITLQNNSIVTFNTESTVVAPAPPGLVLLAGALPFAGLLRLRRRPQVAAPATVA